MSPVGRTSPSAETDPRLLDALASLNRIGAAINRISPWDGGDGRETLRLIAESAIKVVPGASAVIYAYDQAERAFDSTSRVSAGELAGAGPDDVPRPDGIGTRAIGQRRRVISYEEPDLQIHPAKVASGARIMACFPLVVAYRPVGALYVYLHQERRFSQLELLMLDNFVNQAAMAIYQARRLASIQRDLARKEEELKRLRRAGLLISSRLRLEQTLEAILQMAMEVTGARYGIFRLVNESGRYLEASAVASEQEAQPLLQRLPIDSSSVMGWVAQHRSPVCIHDLQAAPWVRIYQPLYANLRMRSELAVPLIGASGRLEGVLNLESPAVGAFSEEDSHLLQALATQAVIAIEQVRLLDALQHVSQLLLVEPCPQVLDHLATLSCDLLDAAASAIWIREGDRLALRSAHPGGLRSQSLPLRGSLTGAVVLSGQPVTADDVRTDPRFHRPDLAQAADWTRALIVPLRTSDDQQPAGAFSVYRVAPEAGRFAESEWDEKVLTLLAHYAALAIQNAARQKALRAAQEQHAVAETFAAFGDVAANVLHHLNNKVGTIPVRIQGIRDKCQPELLANRYLDTNLAEIERSASQAMQAVRTNLLHLHPLHPAPVDVAACVSEAAGATSLPGDVRIETLGLDGLPPVVASERSLTLVFTNLLENAAKAMQGQGTVTIRGEASGGWVEVVVSDTGPGIDPRLRERIFEFNQVHRVPGRSANLGFGLWWVKTLIVRLGGSVAVESSGQGGTAFRLKLPFAEDP